MVYTDESITLAMREIVCQGLEGHRPSSFVGSPGANSWEMVFPCAKCKRLVTVWIVTLKLKVPAPGGEYDGFVNSLRVGIVSP